jgi:hypothetical protein
LRIAVAVLMPADASVELTETTSGPVGQEREQIILATLEESPMTHWMGSTARTWPLVSKRWKIADGGDGRRYTHAVTALTSTADNASFWRVQTPILAGAAVRTGGDLPRHFVEAEFEIGLWLTELGPQRLPSGERSNSRPLPAALSLEEMNGLLTALITTGIESAAALFNRLVTSFDANPPLNLSVQIESQSGINAVINLKQLNRVGVGEPGNCWLAHNFEFHPGRDDARQRATEWALALLGEALLRSGHRGYAETLLALHTEDAVKPPA